jgi:predicted Rdx family selenoprotein
MNPLLESLQFSTVGSVPGLVPVLGDEPSERIEEQHARRQAAEIGGIDYIFFRRFEDGRSSQAAACVIDNADEHLSAHDLALLHQKLWLNGLSPLLYVGWQTRVDILSCARGPDFWNGSDIAYEPAQTIELTRQISLALDERANRFSARRLGDGTFWDEPENAAFADANEASHQQLIRAVVETDRDIEGEKRPVLRRLLLLTILIKYLEDRDVFPDGWFRQFLPNSKSFFDLLEHGDPDIIRELLARLERKFNGDVFALPEDAKRLSKKELRNFADLVEAKTLGMQRYLWEQYSFRHIPVEVLSHLYQHFASSGQGAVFTPPIVAALMLDYAMPYQGLSGTERILDPTCGSGIFLVGAFRRLVQFWQSQRNWERPTVAVLKQLLRDSIFGIEVQEEALHLTAFSLALAVCDSLQPNVIWRELRFDKLVGRNLHVLDFSEWLKQHANASEDKKFTIVIGNPPFLSKLNKTAKDYRLAQKRSSPVPDNQMAYFILEQCQGLLRDDGRLCLIQPGGFLYNAKSRKFQKEFLSQNTVETVLDFTSIRNLYDGADPKTVAIICNNRRPGKAHKILHLTFRRTFSVKERIAFELDHYDRQSVPQAVAETRPWIWRANLLGGGRLVSLAERLDEMPKLKGFLEAKSWEYGEGFVLAETGDPQPAAWLTGQAYLPTKALENNRIDRAQITQITEEGFHRARKPERYEAPLVLIKEVDTLSCAFWDEGFLAYRNQIVGIHAPAADRGLLIKFYEQFLEHQNILRAFCAVFGTRALSSKATSILKRDIDVLPWPDKKNGGWDLNWWEKLLCEEVVQFSSDFVRLGQKSALLRDRADSERLESYCAIFLKLLGSVYKNLRESQSGFLDGLAFQAFCFGEESKLQWGEEWATSLREVVYREHGEALRTVRILRFYERNTIIIVKPDRLRYWIPSTAIRDADETLTDLQRQGY